MQGTKLLGAIFLVLGILALAYGGFTYTETEEKAGSAPCGSRSKTRSA